MSKGTGIVLSVALIAALLLIAADVLLLIFAGILLAIFLTSLAEWISSLTGLRYSWSLILVCTTLLSLITLTIWLLAPNVADQFGQLMQKIPESTEKIRSRIEQYAWAQSLLKEIQLDNLFQTKTGLLQRATGFASNLMGGLLSLIIIFFIGIYGSIEPQTYTRGFVLLFPKPKRSVIREVIEHINETLRWWLIGRFIGMGIIGLFTTLGLWLLDVPLALILGIIAALLTFIPNIGPVLAAIPAILLGLGESPTQALYIALLYFFIQFIESYLISPMIYRKTVSLPPALTLSAQVFLGVLFGILGVALATPLTAAAMVGTKKLYIEKTLGEEEV